VCLWVILLHLSSQIIISAPDKNGMLHCMYVLSRTMKEFGVLLDKRILYMCNITNNVKSRFVMPIPGDEAVRIDKISFHFS
jgi:hypothetical protein